MNNPSPSGNPSVRQETAIESIETQGPPSNGALSIDHVLEGLNQLPKQWTRTGSVRPEALRTIVKHVGNRILSHSAETGSGKTTILLSHLSQDHKVFALNDYAGTDTNSITGVRTSRLFNPQRVEFIDGPTQLTLPTYKFEHKLQFAMIDGPHAYPFPDLEYFYLYPQLEVGALLVIDDIHIPTIRHMFDFLKEDEMFSLLEVVGKTAFFQRADVPTFPTILDDWWLQNYNKKRFPLKDNPVAPVHPSIPPPNRKSFPLTLRRKLKRLLG